MTHAKYTAIRILWPHGRSMVGIHIPRKEAKETVGKNMKRVCSNGRRSRVQENEGGRRCPCGNADGRKPTWWDFKEEHNVSEE